MLDLVVHGAVVLTAGTVDMTVVGTLLVAAAGFAQLFSP